MKIEIQPYEITKSEQNPIELFYQSLRSDYTRTDYVNKMKKVLCEFLRVVLKGDPELVKKQDADPVKRRGRKRYFNDADFEARANELVKRAKADPEWAETTLLKVSEKLAQRCKLQKDDPDYLDPVSIKNHFNPIWKLFEMNGITISWTRIRNTFPQDNESKDDTFEYTHEDIQTMLEHCKIEDKVLVLLYASSGIRAGASEFKWKHLRPVYRYEGKYLIDEHEITESVAKNGKIVCGMLRVYPNSKSEYFAFITPECWKAVQAYRQAWIQDVGKEPKPDDPFFKRTGSLVIPAEKLAVRKRLERILKDSGLRTPLPKGARRHKVPAFNGFRRFFNKQNKKSLSSNSALASLILKENMLGHTGLIKLDENYFKQHIEELIDEYLNSVSYLTISNEERLLIQNKKLEEDKSELEKKIPILVKESIEKMKNELLQNGWNFSSRKFTT